ncbi:MAG: hypothetical protein UY92_C0002G0075 [Candidatus Magasanikbacteria bacterium GW2011_GWA2_56_11]|uniref:Nitroreductase n=1 Tax=Candidatus Magasanikbacteria bacterium GW2011_GWA2_56_11 TaxID=1619044 RepID=A0A0G1YHQ2_9BACT|nr:MAG: hypothetical protein UY92_C0002G0075 [Candidatus Magasanikbacteria bacterium GW2011_GWA2_56_11]
MNFRPDPVLFTPQEFRAQSPEEELRHLCALAHLAPNTHNTQPWQFIVHPEELALDICLNRERVLPASDVIGRQAVISLGAALEHLFIGASHYGWQAAFIPEPVSKEAVGPIAASQSETSRFTRIGRVKFTPGAAGSPEESGLADSLLRRKVIRAEYDPARALPIEFVPALTAELAKRPLTLHIVTDPVRRLMIAEFQAQADNFVINSKRFSRELGEWLRPNDDAGPLGMRGIEFGLQDQEALRLHRGLTGDAPLLPEDGLRFSLGGKIGLEKSPLIGLITTPGDTIADWITAGRALDRALLIATRFGLASSVHAGIVEVSLINRMFAVALGTTERIMGLFRVGYVKNAPDAERPFSHRLEISQVTLSATGKPTP